MIDVNRLLDIRIIKTNYIKKYKIVREKNIIKVYYLNGEKEEISYTSSNLNDIKSEMYYQYDEWSQELDTVFLINIFKSLQMKRRVKKQEFYMDNQHYLSDLRINNYKIDKYLSISELSKMNKSMDETDNYFNLSSVNNYRISTLKKVRNAIINEQKINSKRKVKCK